MNSPIVYLVGAGPGDPDLLTLRAVRLLEKADIVLYDRLVGPAILNYAPQAEQLYVGKDLGQSSSQRQQRIHELLIKHARAGQTVIRLKGGDPFVFGRGSEEALALAEAGIRFEIVPGVSSPIAAPQAAWIPVTHRGMATSFAVFSGQSAFKDGTAIDWTVAARIPTAVFLMGVRNLAYIVAQLQEHGRSSATPVAVIEQGTLPTQRVTVGTLHNIMTLAKEVAISAPAAIVVGEVVLIRQRLEALLQSTSHHDAQAPEAPFQLPPSQASYHVHKA